MNDRTSNQKRNTLRILATLCAFALVGGLATEARSDAGNLIIITNSSNPTSSMSASDVKGLYLGDITQWPGGATVQLFTRPGESTAGIEFFKFLMHMAPSRFRRHWQEHAFAGKPGAPPEEVAEADAIVKRVASTPGAIGFVAKSEVPSPAGVKVISVN